MIYEAQVTFFLCKPLFFLRSEFVKQIKEGVKNNLLVYPEKNKLTFLNQHQNPICKLYLSPYEVSEQKGKLLITYKEQSKNKKIKEKEKSKVIKIVQIKATKACIDEVIQMNSGKKYKSCLSFVPSSVDHISILSGQSPTQKFRGFINLAGVMFIILNLRNIIENFYTYGVRFQSKPIDYIPIIGFLGLLTLIVFAIIAFQIEKFKFKQKLSHFISDKLLMINQFLILIYCSVFCRIFQLDPLTSIFFVSFGVVLVMKLVSYMQVNSELYTIFKRLNKIKQSEYSSYIFANHEISSSNLELILTKKNNWGELISWNKFLYFLAAPTLCYQLQYPKTTSIRKIWLMKRVIELIVIGCLQLVLIIQYIEPQLKAWSHLMDQDYTFGEVFRRLMRLSIPNTMMWIAGFYNLFHVWLNILAQLTYFADRKFYQDWWNCRNIEEYWKTWNLPVHFWCIRHIYNPLLQKGYSKITVNLIVFTISAFAHQFLVCIPLGVISCYAFVAMMMQVPLIIIQRKIDSILHLQNSQLGNVSFWVFFCIIGQPICVFIYYSMYMEQQKYFLNLSSIIPLDALNLIDNINPFVNITNATHDIFM